MILSLAGLLVYLVHTSPDKDYPAGRTPIYCWIALATALLAPMYLWRYFLGQRQASAIATACGFTLCSLGPIYAAGWPASEQLFYQPLSSETWAALSARLPATLICWLVITAPFAIGTWCSAVASIVRSKPDPKLIQDRNGE